MYSKVDRSALPGNDRRTNELAKVDLPPPPKPTRLSPCQSFLILSCNQPVTQPVDGNHASQDPTFSLPDLPVQVARLLQVEYASSRAHEMHRYPLLPMHLLPGHADIHSQVPARLPAMLGRWARNHALYRQQKSRVSELRPPIIKQNEHVQIFEISSGAVVTGRRIIVGGSAVRLANLLANQECISRRTQGHDRSILE